MDSYPSFLCIPSSLLGKLPFPTRARLDTVATRELASSGSGSWGLVLSV